LCAYERIQMFRTILEGGHLIGFAARVDGGQLIPERLVRLERLIPLGHGHPRPRPLSHTYRQRPSATAWNRTSAGSIAHSAVLSSASVSVRQRPVALKNPVAPRCTTHPAGTLPPLLWYGAPHAFAHRGGDTARGRGPFLLMSHGRAF